MNQLTALAWKEWHESRGYLWLALAVFIGLPAIGGIEYAIGFHKGFSISAAPWVVFFGGVLAIFVGVGATCRDFHGRLEDFWRSRAVSPVQWLSVKYAIGLAVVLAGCIVPLLLDILTNRQDDDLTSLVLFFPFLWAAIYSIGFLSGCLIRRTAHAAMLGLAAMLLVYFVPVVIPPLRAFEITTITYYSMYPGLTTNHLANEFIFAGGMLALAAVLLETSLIAVRRDWHIASGRKTMYASASAAFLLLFASAAFQLGTNLPILQQVDLPAGEQALLLRCDGQNGFVITQKTVGPYSSYFFRTIQVSTYGIELGEAQRVYRPDLNDNDFRTYAPQNPRITYRADDYTDQHMRYIDLQAQDLASPRRPTVLNLWKEKTDLGQGHYDFDLAWMLVNQNRLYVDDGYRLFTLDITDPVSPRLISSQPQHGFFGTDFRWDFPLDEITADLPRIGNLPADQRLSMLMVWAGAFDGQVFCQRSRDRLLAYRLKSLNDKQAVFDKIGEYDPSFLENVFGQFFAYAETLHIGNGLLYVASPRSQWQSTVNSRITVLDLHGPRPMRIVGHFAAPGANLICPLNDGRALVAGAKLWLVGPPPHHD